MHERAGTVEMELPRGVETVEIRVRGTVQGVGFRPTVCRLARENDLVGHVLNDSRGVLIRATGEQERIAGFLSCLEANPPPLSRIESLDIRRLDRVVGFDGFRIASSVGGETRTHLAADAATCPACWAEVLDEGGRRYRYPFTNCTHCGPRLSIVTGVPYDRMRTTMAPFAMCAACAAEYGDPSDRRFHAQPIACPACGPELRFELLRDGVVPADAPALAPLDAAVRQIREGRILAIRGLGGFHLACDATNGPAVARLRARKRRFGKPFALMARDETVIRRFASISPLEAELLHSPAAPIVLLRADGPERLPESIAPSLATLGFMLAYTPLHKLILEPFDVPLVMTSGNVSHEPQVTSNAEVSAKLGDIADSVLLHDRDIANRIDDSVVRVMAGRSRMLRRARGFAPSPVPLPKSFAEAPEILAFGGELKSTFCLIKDGAAILSQHQGDLEDLATFDDYQKNLGLYGQLYSCRARVFATDAHPEYLSSKLARERASGGVLHEIQHHHAHIASAMAENGRELDAPPVLGVALDGLGFGADGTLWGGEFLRADYRDFSRLAAFKPVAMIGGAHAIHEPWRNTYAHLLAAFGWEGFQRDFGELELARTLAGKPRAIMDRMLSCAINVPAASSCGRLFDAVAAAVGVSPDRVLFEGQAAMEFEDLIDGDALALAKSRGCYSFSRTRSQTGLEILEPRPMWRALLEDLRLRTPLPVISAKFHLGLAMAVADMAVRLAKSNTSPTDTVVLSGGCFQNKTLIEACVGHIEQSGMRCLTQSQVPMNDGGLALGQAAIAAAREIDARTA
jgi:hydrogenase maturation protein HypF